MEKQPVQAFFSAIGVGDIFGDSEAEGRSLGEEAGVGVGFDDCD